VLRIDAAQHLRRGDFRGMASRLRRPEIAAVAEDGEEISLGRIGKLGVGARGWAEMAGVAGPVLSVFENVEQMTLRHPGT
jgi:hypothetical protein